MSGHDEASVQRRRVLDRKTLSRLALEVFSIVLGVLLALAVSEWQEQRDIEERTRAALVNVQNELEKNLELLEIVHVRNKALIEALVTNASNLDENSNFVPALQISDAAWDMLRTTGLAGYADLDMIVQLSQLYSLVDVYRRSGYSLVDANLQVVAAATAAERDMETIDETNLFARNFIGHFQLIVDIETALIDAHLRVLEALKARKGNR